MLKFYFYNFDDERPTAQIIDEINYLVDNTLQYERMEEIMLFACLPTRSLEAVCAAIPDRHLVKLSSQCFSAQAVTSVPSPDYLVKIGAHCGMLGLPERRYILGETSEQYRKSMKAMLSLGMKAVLCVGENDKMCDDGTAAEVIKAQIGTGLADVTLDDAYRVGVIYRPMREYEGIVTDNAHAEDMLGAVKAALKNVLPELTEELPVFYGGRITTERQNELYGKGLIDGVMVNSSEMTPELFVKMIADTQ